MSFPLDRSQPFAALEISDSEGLARFMARVYGKLAGGLAVSATVAWSLAHVSALRSLFFRLADGDHYAFTGLGLALVLSPLAVLLVAGFRRRTPTAAGVGLLYWTMTILFGGSMAVLVLTYAATTLTSTFLVTAGAFATLSLAGLAARRSLSGLRAFLTMALIGLILATVASIFFKSPLYDFAVNVVGVLIFAGLTAADTQALRRIYHEATAPDGLGAASSYGALTLYLNFLNLFQLLLALRSPRGRR
jgi:FtsH-binding integral membrane protein